MTGEFCTFGIAVYTKLKNAITGSFRNQTLFRSKGVNTTMMPLGENQDYKAESTEFITGKRRDKDIVFSENADYDAVPVEFVNVPPSEDKQYANGGKD